MSFKRKQQIHILSFSTIYNLKIPIVFANVFVFFLKNHASFFVHLCFISNFATVKDKRRLIDAIHT